MENKMIWALNKGCIYTLMQLKEPKTLKDLKGKSSVYFRQYLKELENRGFIKVESVRNYLKNGWLLYYSLTQKGVQFINEHDEEVLQDFTEITDHHKLALLNFYTTGEGNDSRYIKNGKLTALGEKYIKLGGL